MRHALALVVALVLACVVVPPAASATAGTSLAFTPAQPVLGETVNLAGKVPATTARPVRLEVRSGGTWHLVQSATSTRRGRFSFVVDTARAASTYRVTAPATRRPRAARAVTPLAAVPAGVAPKLIGTLTDVSSQRPAGDLEADADLTRWAVMSGDDVVAGQDPDYLDNIFYYRRAGGGPVLVTQPDDSTWHHTEAPLLQSVSDDGRYVLYSFQGYQDAQEQIPFEELRLWDSTTASTRVLVRVDHSIEDYETDFLNARMSSDDRYVSYGTRKRGFPDDELHVRRLDLTTGTTTELLGDVASFTGQFDVTPDGRFVVYGAATGAGDGPDGIYLRTVATGVSRLVSVTPSGAAPNAYSSSPTISDDGSLVAYSSTASDIDARDPDHQRDNYLVDPTTLHTTLLSADAEGRSWGDNLYLQAPRFTHDGGLLTMGRNLRLYDVARDLRLDGLFARGGDGRPVSLCGGLAGPASMSTDGSEVMVDDDCADRTVIWSRAG